MIVCSAESHSGTVRDGTAEQSCDSGPGEEGCSDGSEEGPPNGRDRNLEPGGVCRADCGEHERPRSDSDPHTTAGQDGGEEKHHQQLSLEPATTADITYDPPPPDAIPRDLGGVFRLSEFLHVFEIGDLSSIQLNKPCKTTLKDPHH